MIGFIIGFIIGIFVCCLGSAIVAATRIDRRGKK